METRVDGIRLAYDLTGEGPPIVFAHSLAMDRTLWHAQERHFSPRHRVLTYDARGHGASDKPPGPYTIEQFGEDLYAVMRAAGIARAVVVGLSMGGMTAQALAIAHPEVVEALVLADTTCWYGPEAPQAWGQRAQQAEAEGLASLLDFQVTRWFAERTRAERRDLVEQATRVFLANDVAAYAASCRMLGALDLREGVAQLRCPTLVLVGDEDYATPPAMAEDLQRRIPGADLVVLPGVRHLSAVEAPDVVNAHIDTLVARAS
jgi:3-oxoadipate enol-lactonase